MNRQSSDISASVRQKLLNISRAKHQEHQLTLTQYAIERLLYRLSVSQYKEQFVLKGAVLFSIWSEQSHRPTQDLDMLGWGDDSISRLKQVFRDVCDIEVEDDGLAFLADSIAVEEIRENQDYGGLRVTLTAQLGVARIPVQVDVGFGDAVTPGPEDIIYPTMLSFSAPHIRAYPRETVVAEKFHAMIFLGMLNSRMKDYYDLWTLASEFPFNGQTLSTAIAHTFSRRQTRIPRELPLALTKEFTGDATKQTQWSAFLRKGKLQPANLDLGQVVVVLSDFLMQPTSAAADNDPFGLFWPPSGFWLPDV